ncbi:MAG: ApeA N-terminal domain 1-containing protein [Blastococcus sp.]
MTTTEAGLFWLPEAPDNAVQGKLEVSDGGVARIELMGPITPAMRVHSHSAETGSTMLVPADDPPNLVIHGSLAGRPNRVSLIDCWTPNRTTTHTAAGAIEIQTVQASRLMRGDHIAGDQATFTGLRLRVAGLDAWAGLPGPREERSDDGGVALYLDPFSAESLITSSDAELTLNEQMLTQRRLRGGTTVKRAVWVELTKLGDLSYRQIDAQYVTAIVGYLSFALGRSVPLTALEVLHGDTWVSVTHTGMRPGAREEESFRHVLLPLGSAGLDVISSFLDIYQKVGPAIPITQDALSNERNATIDTLVLELTTVAEGLHRDLYPEQERMTEEDAVRVRALIAEAFKDESNPRFKDIVNGSIFNFLSEPSYPSRLKRLLEDAREPLPGLFGKEKKWIEAVSDARNTFAHRKNGFIDEALIDQMHAVTQSLKWLFWAVILRRAGVPADVLKGSIEQHQPYSFFLRGVRKTVPKIYGE